MKNASNWHVVTVYTQSAILLMIQVSQQKQPQRFVSKHISDCITLNSISTNTVNQSNHSVIRKQISPDTIQQNL